MFKSNIEGRTAPKGKEPNLPGDRYGRLTLVEEVAGQECIPSRRKWLCRCSCGEARHVRLDRLRSSGTLSCRCVQQEAGQVRRVRRGRPRSSDALSRHPLRATHKNMMQRCYNPKNKRFASYGARGIHVCERWHDIRNFIEDMYPTYSPELSLERTDNTLGYSLENCVWATDVQQQRNTRSNRLVSYLGKNICLTEACEITGLPYDRVRSRLTKLGWPIKKALESENFSDPLPKMAV